MIKCGVCGYDNPDDGTTCMNCGSPIEKAKMGEAIDDISGEATVMIGQSLIPPSPQAKPTPAAPPPQAAPRPVPPKPEPPRPTAPKPAAPKPPVAQPPVNRPAQPPVQQPAPSGDNKFLIVTLIAVVVVLALLVIALGVVVLTR